MKFVVQMALGRHLLLCFDWATSHNTFAIFASYFALQIDVRPNDAMTENPL